MFAKRHRPLSKFKSITTLFPLNSLVSSMRRDVKLAWYELREKEPEEGEKKREGYAYIYL